MAYNLLSLANGASAKTFKHSGFTTSISTSFTNVGGSSATGITWDGTNFYTSVSGAIDKLVRHSGFTATVSVSYTRPRGTVRRGGGHGGQ